MWTGLEYNQSYQVEVFAHHPNGTRLGSEAARLFFSTGFDTRAIATAPVVTVTPDAYGLNLTWTAAPNADYYDIFRCTNGGPLTWTDRSLTTAFADGTVPPGASVAYIVRARNDNTYADSAQTAAVVWTVFEITGVTRTGAGGQNIALTFPGYAGATYRVEKSASLAVNSWMDTGVSASAIGGAQTLTVPAAVTGGAPGRYYFRVVGGESWCFAARTRSGL